MVSACRRPPGSSIRYCCSGSTPNVYLISKSAGLPSGPSVRTKNLPSRLEKIAVLPRCSKRRSAKSPRTVCAVASCIARACCESVQALVSLAWQPAQAWLPTNVGGAADTAATGAAVRSHGRHIASAARPPTKSTTATISSRRLSFGCGAAGIAAFAVGSAEGLRMRAGGRFFGMEQSECNRHFRGPRSVPCSPRSSSLRA